MHSIDTTRPGPASPLEHQVWKASQLLDAGLSRARISALLADGQLTRLRHGWYAASTADPEVVRAVRAGGALTCVSSLARLGVWRPAGSGLHVRVDHNRTGPLPDGMLRCHPVGDEVLAPREAVDVPELALRCAWRCQPHDEFVAICDSLVKLRLATLDDIRAVLAPAHGLEEVLAACDLAESGTETLVRLRLRRRGIGVRSQVVVPGVGRVDLLVGERLVIEVDSRAHHTGVENFASDRRRDLALRALGYVVVRLSYQQVVLDWPATEQSLLAMVRRGDHLAPRRGRPRAA